LSAGWFYNGGRQKKVFHIQYVKSPGRKGKVQRIGLGISGLRTLKTTARRKKSPVAKGQGNGLEKMVVYALRIFAEREWGRN